jgi:MerR family transcriptional regulator, thiopeptide resistance regulator
MRTWPTAAVAAMTGVSARTLRHYDAIGLLEPASVGHGGIRRYGHAELLRLQQILLFRRLGLRLDVIADILDGGLDTVEALRRHADRLAEERARLDTLAATVDATIRQIQEGRHMEPETWFDGLDAGRHNEYEAEARRRWGDQAIDRANTAVRQMSDDERAALPATFDDINRRLAALLASGSDAADADVQAVIAEHYRFVERFWSSAPTAEAYKGLGALYTEDARFTATFDALEPGLAVFVRDAMRRYADRLPA